ncbi:cysteine--tRNA ligase [Candidatus Saccharibacteria bacterium]|nr:cysteine--tRNA ligase [Candidatus Saccharibacteria bacterium]
MKITPKFYNTASRTVEEFKQTEELVKIYTCGPTVYNYQHIGNFMAYVYWDVLIRMFHALDIKTKRLMNITDVGHLTSDADEGEDKMEKGARAANKTVWEIADFYTNDFLEHFHKLNLIEPDKTARATNYIDASMAIVDRLTEKGYTYETSDGIYYDTSKFPRYADFARLDLKGLEAGKRVGFNNEKKSVSDFALWKFVREGEKHDMQWEYLGRPGYPGWHIECVAITLAELGESIDIHTGGIEHIPVHHTNEIAEVEPLTDKPLSRFWLHNNHVKIDGEKISKSLGNVILLPDLLANGFNYMDFKMWVLEGHYQKERNFTWEGLEAAKSRLANWRKYASFRHQGEALAQDANEDDAIRKIKEAVADNLSTQRALTEVDYYHSVVTSEPFWQAIDDLLGLNIVESTPPLTKEQQALLDARYVARTIKDFAESDRLRDELLSDGIAILDGASGLQTWYHA